MQQRLSALKSHLLLEQFIFKNFFFPTDILVYLGKDVCATTLTAAIFRTESNLDFHQPGYIKYGPSL